MFFDLGTDINQVHKYIQSLQTYFLKELSGKLNFIETDLTQLGHFLTIEFSNEKQLEVFYNQLVRDGIQVDYRGLRLRFGFGLYLDQDDIEQLL